MKTITLVNAQYRALYDVIFPKNSFFEIRLE